MSTGEWLLLVVYISQTQNSALCESRELQNRSNQFLCWIAEMAPKLKCRFSLRLAFCDCYLVFLCCNFVAVSFLFTSTSQVIGQEDWVLHLSVCHLQCLECDVKACFYTTNIDFIAVANYVAKSSIEEHLNVPKYSANFDAVELQLRAEISYTQWQLCNGVCTAKRHLLAVATGKERQLPPNSRLAPRILPYIYLIQCIDRSPHVKYILN